MRIVKSVHFDAAHFLPTDTAGAGEDARPYARMHGHSFLLEIEIAGEPDPKAGWVADFGDVNDALAAIREELDHRLLNDIEGLGLPTLENICKWVAQKLATQFAGLTRVSVSRPSNGETCHYDVI